MAQQRRAKRSKEQITADKIRANEQKIQEYQEKIEALQQQNEALRNPPATMKDIARVIQERNLSLDDVMKAVAQLK